MVRNKNFMWVCFIVLLILGAGCNNGVNSYSGASGISGGQTASLQEEPSPISVQFEITDNPASRWQEITLTFTDEQGMPLSNEEVRFEQKDLDFLFSIEYGGLEPEMFADEGYAGLFWNLGVNAFQLSPYHLWSMFEPEDDDFRWWVEYAPPSFCPEILDGESDTCPQESLDNPIYNYKLSDERKPFINGIAWVGMYFYEYENLCMNRNPYFLDCRDIDGQYRAEYEEFLTAFVEHYKDQISLYRLGLESNWGEFTGSAQDKDMQWTADWIKMQCDIIKHIDPESLISVDLLDFRSRPEAEQHFQDITASFRSRGIKSLPMLEDEFVELLIDKDIQFDVIGIELHPGYMITFEYAEAELALLETFGKPIYVWENFVPSGGDDNIALDSCTRNGTCPPEGYSEEYQAQSVLRFMQMLIEEHPSVIGFEYLGFRDNRDLLEPLPSSREPDVCLTHGWVTENAEPKLVYETVRDYWFGLFTNGKSMTDENGHIHFEAIPGWFNISIQGRSTVIEILQKSSDLAHYF